MAAFIIMSREEDMIRRATPLLRHEARICSYIVTLMISFILLFRERYAMFIT